MLAHRLHVSHFEPGVFQQRHGFADRAHMHVRRDVRLDERPAAGQAAPGHLLDQHPALLAYEPMQASGEGRG